eukprot:359131-Chlamydomonas_euryale.AAC.5
MKQLRGARDSPGRRGASDAAAASAGSDMHAGAGEHTVPASHGPAAAAAADVDACAAGAGEHDVHAAPPASAAPPRAGVDADEGRTFVGVAVAHPCTASPCNERTADAVPAHAHGDSGDDVQVGTPEVAAACAAPPGRTPHPARCRPAASVFDVGEPSRTAHTNPTPAASANPTARGPLGSDVGMPDASTTEARACGGSPHLAGVDVEASAVPSTAVPVAASGSRCAASGGAGDDGMKEAQRMGGERATGAHGTGGERATGAHGTGDGCDPAHARPQQQQPMQDGQQQKTGPGELGQVGEQQQGQQTQGQSRNNTQQQQQQQPQQGLDACVAASALRPARPPDAAAEVAAFALLEELVAATDGWLCGRMEALSARLCRCVAGMRRCEDRTAVVSAVADEARTCVAPE